MTHRINPAGEPITDDDATIAAALEDVSIPTLMLSMVHMTGDPPCIRGDIKPARAVPQRGPGLSVRGAARPRSDACALEVIAAYRDRGCALPPPPSRRAAAR